MIRQFRDDTALLFIDVRQGVDMLSHWGCPTGRRNNPQAETKMLALPAAWRQRRGLPVVFTRHDSRAAASPLKLSRPGGRMNPGFEPAAGEIIVQKDVNSSFIGTDLACATTNRRGLNGIDFEPEAVHAMTVANLHGEFCTALGASVLLEPPSADAGQLSRA
jgi:nicotinamidase-related amidase